jgi:hypothetical protein
MTRDEAVAAIAASRDETLGREIEVKAGKESWRVTPAELGTTAEIEALVDRALELNDQYPWPSRVFHRLTDRDVGFEEDLEFRLDEGRVRRFIEAYRGIDHHRK